MNRQLHRAPSTKPPLAGLLLSWGLGAVLVVAFVIAWVVRADPPWVIEAIDSVFPGLVQTLRDNF